MSKEAAPAMAAADAITGDLAGAPTRFFQKSAARSKSGSLVRRIVIAMSALLVDGAAVWLLTMLVQFLRRP